MKRFPQFSPILSFALIVTLLIVLTSRRSEAAAISSNYSILRRIARATPQEVCVTNQICGWGVHSPSNKEIEHYVTSSCDCVPTEQCVQLGEDVTVPAYIYRCKPPGFKKRMRPLH